MTAIDTMLHQPVAQAIGWALLQFVWQGALIGALTAALLLALRRSAADVRYVVATIALALMCTMPVVTMVQSFPAAPRPDGTSRAAAPVSAVDAATPAPAAAATTSALPALAPRPAPAPGGQPVESWLPLFVSLWLAGVAVLTLRLLSGWIWVQRMKSHGTHFADARVVSAARRLTRRLHITRPIRFLESSLIEVPTVIGWLKPVVLLPASALAGLTPRQLEGILAHELAHIRRHDYLVNLLQTVVETLLFYHPAVWWLSRRIRIEREHCCDDLAVGLCGDPVTYAAALAEMEGLRASSGRFVLAASGGSLLQRVRRLLGAPTHAGRAPGWLAAGLAVLVMVGLAAGASGGDAIGADAAGAVVPAQSTEPSPPAPPMPLSAPAAPRDPALETASIAEQARQAAPATAAQIPERAGDARSAVQATTAAAAEKTQPARAGATAAASAGTEPATTPAVAAAAAEATRAAESTQPVASTPAVAQSSQTVQTRSERNGERSGNYVWSDNGVRLEVSYRGDIEFTDDDSDIRRISPGGSLRIRHGGWLNGWFSRGTAVEFQADGQGNIERRFWLAGSERPFEPEGRRWLAQMLPRFIRQSGIGAPARVARIFKARGVPGVLAEISLIEGSWAKRLYFTTLFEMPGLQPRDVQQALAQAGREIDSDFELATLLIAADHLVTDEATARAYFDAARTVGSDFEMRRVFSSALKKRAIPSSRLALMLDAGTAIESDFEQATLLVQVAEQQPLDASTRSAFFHALATVGSAFEHRRVLSAVLQRGELTPEAQIGLLESASHVDSDFEAASLLLDFAKRHAVEGGVRAPFFKALATVSSSFERGRVLQALAKRSDASDETVKEIIRSAQAIDSGFEKSQVLLAIAAHHELSREARDAYIDASEKLGNFEQGRVLSALVKNERRPTARQR